MSREIPLIEVERPGPVMVKTRFVCPQCKQSIEYLARTAETSVIVETCIRGGHRITSVMRVGEVRPREWSD